MCIDVSVHRCLCFPWTVCLPPYQLQNGGYTCHPSSCGHLSHGTVVEYFCDEGYILKGDYKYLTCQYGEWDSQLKLSCLLEQGKQNKMGYLWILSLLGASTIRLFHFSPRQLSQTSPGDACLINSGIHSQLSGSDPVSGGSVCTSATQAEVSQPVSLSLNSHFQLLLQDRSSHRRTGGVFNFPGLPHLPRRDQGVSGQPVSIMVEGVQVTLPSYEEAVSSSRASASSESRVQIVLSEGQHTTAAEAGPSRPPYLKQQQSESVVVHPAPLSSSSPSPSSSTWALEHAGAAASSSSHRRPSAGTDQHNLSLDSEMDYSDGTALITPSLIIFRPPTVC